MVDVDGDSEGDFDGLELGDFDGENSPSAMANWNPTMPSPDAAYAVAATEAPASTMVFVPHTPAAFPAAVPSLTSARSDHPVPPQVNPPSSPPSNAATNMPIQAATVVVTWAILSGVADTPLAMTLSAPV